LFSGDVFGSLLATDYKVRLQTMQSKQHIILLC